MACELDTSDL